MHAVAANPQAAASAASAASPSTSSMSRCTASIAALPNAPAASSTADRACVATSRYAPDGARLDVPPSDATRSSAPHMSPTTFGSAAIDATLTTPAAVSMSATTS